MVRVGNVVAVINDATGYPNFEDMGTIKQFDGTEALIQRYSTHFGDEEYFEKNEKPQKVKISKLQAVARFPKYKVGDIVTVKRLEEVRRNSRCKKFYLSLL